MAASGLSKTTVYLRMKDTDPNLNPFPPSRRYRRGRGPTTSVFWVLADIEAWQAAEMGLAEAPYPNWPSMQPAAATVATDPLALLG